jgi:hypothetical protein
MKTLFYNIIFVIAVLLISNPLGAQGLSYKTLNTCQNDYSEILKSTDIVDVTSVKELPPGIYLARSITQSLEKENEKYFSYLSLLESSQNTPDVCYKGAPASVIRTQAFVPTLIDQSPDHKLGHTFWSFSAVIDKLTGAVHSKRSLIPTKNYKEALINQGYKVVSSQKNHDEYQIRLERNIASWKETIVISYDQF